MEKTENKANKKPITRIEKSNKLSINMIKLLLPNLEKSFYLNIIINDSINLKTKLLDFKKGNLIELNQIFEFEQSIQGIETIKFNLLEKNSIFSSVIYKGEFSFENKYVDKTTNCNLCFLSNNDKENCIVVYFRYELNLDLIENFDDNLKTLNESIDFKTKNQQSMFENLKDIASGENAANFTTFVKNMDYLKIVNYEIINFIYWKDKWKTFSISFFITLLFIYPKFFLCISPIFIIFLHVYNRKNLSDFSFKNKRYDNLENINFIIKIIELTNFIVEIYESFIEAMEHCERNIIEDIYINFIKLIFLNFAIFYSGILSFSFGIKLILVIFWAFILWNYPPIQAFCKFFLNFILQKFFNMNQNSFRIFITNYFNNSNSEYLGISSKANAGLILNENKNSISNLQNNFSLNSNINSSVPIGLNLKNSNASNLQNSCESNLNINLQKTKKFISFLFLKAFSFIPFARFFLFIITFDSTINNADNINNSVGNSSREKKKFDFNEIFKSINNQTLTDASSKSVNINNDILSDESLKTQSLKYEILENERWWMFVGWTKNLISNERPIWSDISGKNYLDFKSVFLPGLNYEWIGNWTIELSENNDDEGWEYASDFNSKFSLNSFSKYVRRRKWVRYARRLE